VAARGQDGVVTGSDLLAVDRIEDRLFRGTVPSDARLITTRGLVAAQALLSAQLTVPDQRLAHSAHAYFLRPADLDTPVVYRVTVVRDGGGFCHRQVRASQDGVTVLTLTTSFCPDFTTYASQSQSHTAVDSGAAHPVGERVPAWPVGPLEVTALSRPVAGTMHMTRRLVRIAPDFANQPAASNWLWMYLSDLEAPTSDLFGDVCGHLHDVPIDMGVWFQRRHAALGCWLVYQQTVEDPEGRRYTVQARLADEDANGVATVVQDRYSVRLA
jgi:acyl-CoA thioesterase-2